VYLPPSAFESWFVSTAHDEKAIERVAGGRAGAPPGGGGGAPGGPRAAGAAARRRPPPPGPAW
ncbi:aspartate aminotransferase family protein, partial [Streptomyces yangpuensis]